MTKKVKVLLIGGLPSPYGGVTVFLSRLIDRLSGDIDFHVLDSNPGLKVKSLAITHKIGPKNFIFKSLWLLKNIFYFKGDIIHLNFSLPDKILILNLIARRKRKIFLTLHNGSLLEVYERLGTIRRLLIRLGASKVDKFFVLSPSQEIFYRLIGVSNLKIVRTKSQIPITSISRQYIDDQHRLFCAKFDKIVISSGYVNRSYNFEFVIKFVNDMSNVGGILFFYGTPVDTIYLYDLKNLISRPDSILIYFNQDEKSFLSAIYNSDAYLRPTFVDSWGIAVADAISLGIPAIASNICERAFGARLCDPNDYNSFFMLTAEAINMPIKNKNITTIDYSKIFLESYKN
jgi:hypothetical protein